jgi:recombination protein RecT
MTTNEIQTAPPAPANNLQKMLQSPQIKARFEEVLGKQAPSFMSSIISAVNATPALKECDPMSVVSAAAIAAAVQLPINPSLGLAFIVPYKGTAQFQIGWKGFVQLALRSGQYKTINVARVFENQLKSRNPFTGDMQFNEVEPRGDVVGYLLYFRLINGYEKYFYMTKPEVEAHAKQYSATYKKGFGVWRDNFDAMALKTVCKLGLSKYGILSVEMQQAVQSDQAEITPDGEPRYVDNQTEPAAPAAEGSTIQKLNSRVKKDTTVTTEPAPEKGKHF